MARLNTAHLSPAVLGGLETKRELDVVTNEAMLFGAAQTDNTRVAQW